MTTTTDIQQMDTLKLRRMADELKVDCRVLWDAGSKPEAMVLFRLFRRLTEELHRRQHPANIHRWN